MLCRVEERESGGLFGGGLGEGVGWGEGGGEGEVWFGFDDDVGGFEEVVAGGT